MRVVSLELNELNFHYVREFVAKGYLPNFGGLLANHDLVETDAAEVYPQLEPWIQWPTVYTGKTYADHGLFRLGGIAYKDQPQIWDCLESYGVMVGAISPMNASNRCKDPAFFLPDPWTHTKTVAEPRAEKLFSLLAQMANDNASSGTSVAGFAKQILPLALPYLSRRSIGGKILPMALQYKWAKAAFLDRLLTDLFIALWQKNKPGYASLFLNAGAHVQHHHTYDSAVYSGTRANPVWYSKAAETDADPLLFIYQAYDEIVGEFLALKDAHLFITTGLSQVPNERAHYQYRIVDFDTFFSKVELAGVTVRPRMSRDFLLEFADVDSAKAALPILDRVRCGGRPLFSVEERGNALFCQVADFREPSGLKQISIAGIEGDRSEDFVLVSIENALHRATGYHIDTRRPKTGEKRILLPEVFTRLKDAAISASASLSTAA